MNPSRLQRSQTPPRAPQVSIVVPCYNEVGNVAVLVEVIEQAMPHHEWEIIFVDDNSPDGTMEEVRKLAASDGRVRGLRRIGRRGLSSAVIEGALSSSAEIIAVMDGDLQHDERCLEEMVDVLLRGEADVAVASRYVRGGNRSGLGNGVLNKGWRHLLSHGGTLLARWVLGVELTDPMSGYFALPRRRFEVVAPHLSQHGFKILLDLVMTLPAPEKLRVHEVPMVFRARYSGESKLGFEALLSFAGLVVKGACRRHPARIVSTVGSMGLLGGLVLLGKRYKARKHVELNSKSAPTARGAV